MNTYNGHKNWTYWNVSLWIGSEEGLYRLAEEFRDRHSKRDAAKAMLEHLHECGVTETPDGAVYTATNIAAAMRD